MAVCNSVTCKNRAVLAFVRLWKLQKVMESKETGGTSAVPAGK